MVLYGFTMGFMGKSWEYMGIPGLVNIQKTNWKMAIEIVDLSIKNGDFP
jgi:hypothetical protein